MSNQRSRPSLMAALSRIRWLIVSLWVVLEVVFVTLVLGYVVLALLIWAGVVGPIKPIHEWFGR
jgi:hypothetical protein